MAELDILIEAEGWRDIPDVEKRAEAAALAALKSVHPRKWQRLSATILLADDATLHRLNRDFRNKDKPTNVLSFPVASQPGVADDGFLGDIALAFGVTSREAAEEGKTVADHMSHLVVHGILHLLGYDHETDDDAVVMETRETRILAGMGIADPHIDQDGRSGGATE
jgi:probable rRNA maturation factor